VNVEEYLGQREHYFSESTGQLVRLDQMPWPHAYYSYMKLYREFGDEFIGSELWRGFNNLLFPSGPELTVQLEKYGKASHTVYTPKHAQAVRSKFYRAGKKLGVKIHTHITKEWIVGEVIQPVVKVKGRVIS
jgi:hypothetical protein